MAKGRPSSDLNLSLLTEIDDFSLLDIWVEFYLVVVGNLTGVFDELGDVGLGEV